MSGQNVLTDLKHTHRMGPTHDVRDPILRGSFSCFEADLPPPCIKLKPPNVLQ